VTMTAFAEQNDCEIYLELTTAKHKDGPDIAARAYAWPKNSDRRGARPLALVSLTWREGRYRSLTGLLFYLMYHLDFKLAEYEWGTTKGGNEPPPAQ
jgi:hypothetical protein